MGLRNNWATKNMQNLIEAVPADEFAMGLVIGRSHAAGQAPDRRALRVTILPLA